MQKRVNTMIISDVHLGLDTCQAELLLATLKRFRFVRLVLVGDIGHDHLISDVKELNDEQFALLNYLRKLRKEDRVDIIRIRGNHDWPSMDYIGRFLGIKSRKKYLLKLEGGKKVLFIHGHQWDLFITKTAFLSRIVARLFLWCQYWPWLARKLDRWQGLYFRLGKRVAAGAIRYAHKKGVSAIVCGHTHESELFTDEKKGHITIYCNCGDWVGSASLAVLYANGDIEEYEFA